MRVALDMLTEVESTERRIRLSETLEQTYLEHDA